MSSPDTGAAGRRSIYWLLIAVSVGVTGGRLLSAERLNEPSVHRADDDRTTPRPAWPKARPRPTPMFGSNDRSRWALVRALVDEGTFVIGRRDKRVVLASAPAALAARDPLGLAALLEAGYRLRVASDRGIIFEESYQSVDKVLHPARMEFYSTKPPLLSVIVAGEYWLLKHLFGWTLKDDPFTVVRVVLLTINLLPMVLYLALLGRLAERFAETDWARYYVVAAGGLGTLLTPFLITFSNHTVAVTTTLVAVWAVARILELSPPEAGGEGLRVRGVESGARPTPSPASGPRASRGGGPLPGNGGEGRRWHFVLAGLMAGFTACNELPALALAAGLFAFLLWKFPRPALAIFLPAMLVPIAALLALDYAQTGEVVPVYSKFGGPWYEYEGSHWRVPPGATKRGIDFAGRNGETKLTYAFHLLVGHHGLFLLTPVMLLAFVGMGVGLAKGQPLPPRPLPEAERGGQHGAVLRLVTLFTLLLSVVVIGFYLVKSDNYGGWSNGPRWLMWLSPLWLLTMLPVLDWMAGRRWGRGAALVLLAWSIASMHYQPWNAWRHPWAYNWMESRGWVNY